MKPPKLGYQAALLFLALFVGSANEAIAQPFEYKPGVCLDYEFLKGDTRTLSRDCIRSVEGSVVTLTNDGTFDAKNRNALSWNMDVRYAIADGVFSSKPSCLPGLSSCDRDLSQDTSPETWELDGKFRIEGSQQQGRWSKFSFRSRVVACEVLGVAEKCVEGVRRGLIDWGKGVRESVEDIQRVALSGKARGHLVSFKHINRESDERSWDRNLLQIEDRSAVTVPQSLVAEVDAPPFVDDRGRKAWGAYKRRNDRSIAFALAIDGSWAGSKGTDPQAAAEAAIANCQKYTKAKCEIFAVDEKIVFRR